MTEPTVPSVSAVARVVRKVALFAGEPRRILQGLHRRRERRALARRQFRVRATLDRIRPLPLAPAAGADEVEVHVLTSHGFVADTLLSLHSFYRHAPTPWPLVVHDWGAPDPLDGADVAMLARHFPGARVVLRLEADALVVGELRRRGLERCIEARAAEHLGLKLFDVDLLGRGKRVVFFDADVLFLRRPDALFEALAVPAHRWRDRYLRDIVPAYTWTPAEVAAAGETLPPSVNTGLYLVRPSTDPWERFERVLAIPRPPGIARLVEQSLRAIEFARSGAEPFPPDYDVSFRHAWGAAYELPERHGWVTSRRKGKPVIVQHYCGALPGLREMFYDAGEAAVTG